MSKHLNHTRLAETVANESGLSLATVATVLRVTFDVIGRTVMDHGRVSVTNFGSWHADKTPRRVRRNPQTGEEWMAPATWYPRFTWSPRVRKATVSGEVLATLAKRGKGKA